MNLVQILGLIVPLLLGVAFLTLAERKIMASMQRRKGPNVVGIFGIFQPIVDGLKLIIKEPILPSKANLVVYLLAPVVSFILAILLWAVIPFGYGQVLADLSVGILYLFAVSSLGVYGVIMAGWASNSKYAFLGSLRSAAQIVSYEVSIGLILMTVLLCAGTLNLSLIVEAQKNLLVCITIISFAYYVFY